MPFVNKTDFSVGKNPIEISQFVQNFGYSSFVPPDESEFIITESGEDILTENGNFLITET